MLQHRLGLDTAPLFLVYESKIVVAIFCTTYFLKEKAHIPTKELSAVVYHFMSAKCSDNP